MSKTAFWTYVGVMVLGIVSVFILAVATLPRPEVYVEGE